LKLISAYKPSNIDFIGAKMKDTLHFIIKEMASRDRLAIVE